MVVLFGHFLRLSGSIGETGASPPLGFYFKFVTITFVGNSGNMTLLHIHQSTSHGNMRLASQNRKSEGRNLIFGVESKNKFLIISYS